MKTNDIRELFFSLDTELPSLRESVALAKIIGRYPGSRLSRNPVINFAFSQVGSAVISRTILELSEAIPFLDRAWHRHFGKSLMRPTPAARARRSAGRRRQPHDQLLTLLLDLRDKTVAHRVENRVADALSFLKQRGFTDPYLFLDRVMSRMQELLRELADADYFHGHDLGASRRLLSPFGTTNVRRVVAAANRLVPRAPRGAR